MGFFVVEEIKIQELGVVVSNSYITVKGTYNLSKYGMFGAFPVSPLAAVGKYNLQITYYIYAEKPIDESLRPLRTEQMVIPLEAYPNIPINVIYEKIKADKFFGKSYIDDV